MTVKMLPYKHAENREYTYSVKRNRPSKYPRCSVLSHYAFRVLADLISDEERFYSSWMRQTITIEKDIYKKILSHANKPITAREKFIYNSLVNWPQILEPVSKKPSINVSYINHDSIDTLLGIKGKTTLGKVINLIQKGAEEEHWPITNIEVQYRKDTEVENWEYLIIVLYYDSSFNDANECLNSLFTCLDDLAERLDPDEKDILAELIYIDIRTNNDISSD